MKLALSLILLFSLASLAIAVSNPLEHVHRRTDDSDTLGCPICEKAVIALETNKTDAEILHDLDSVCKILPSAISKDCLDALKEFSALVDGQSEGLLTKYTPYAICSILRTCAFDCCPVPYTPEQIHISLAGADFKDMTVNWVTLNAVKNATVWWGLSPDNLNNSAPASFTQNTLGGWRGTIYTATMTNLLPATRYYYRVGTTSEESFWTKPALSQPELTFLAPSNEPFPVRVAVVGDIGATDVSDFTVRRIANAVADQVVDFTLFDGDLSYADGVEYIEDAYLRKIEPIAAYAPHMAAPGNHEGFYNFLNYKDRYSVPYKESGSNDPLYYSFNYGGVHFINFNTEGEFGLSVGNINKTSPQYLWLVADLKKANENRDKQPWVVLSGHRPFYCVENNKDCVELAQYLRSQLEILIMEQKVDVVISAHVHNYQRSAPVFNGVRMSGYVNPAAPVYILNGAGGNKEHLAGVPSSLPSYMEFASSIYGYGILTAHNATQLQWQFLSSQSNSIIDDFSIVRTQ